MKVFELHFNPKKKQESIFDSFVYEGENQEENILGNLCMAGELTSAMPQNSYFLGELSAIIKNNFYTAKDFSQALKEANNFLEKEAKSGNVNWLGNLNFAVLNIGNSIINFTKVGDVKILLLRDGEVLDISQNLELQDQEPYPMKVFSNIASGKLLSKDKIIILTKDVFKMVSRNETFLNQLNFADSEKDIKKIFKANNGIFSEISGLSVLITHMHELGSHGQSNVQFGNFAKRIPKKTILIACFLLIVAVSYFFFKNEERTSISQPNTEINLEEVRSKISMAENFLIMKKNEKAQALFQEAWDLLQLVNTKEALSLKESIKKHIISVQP